jgi:hypothetical protein
VGSPTPIHPRRLGDRLDAAVRLGATARPTTQLAGISEPDESLLAAGVALNFEYHQGGRFVPGTLASAVSELRKTTNVLVACTNRRLIMISTGVAGGVREHVSIPYEGLRLLNRPGCGGVEPLRGRGRVGERRLRRTSLPTGLVSAPSAAASNRVEARLALAPPTPPGMRVRTVDREGLVGIEQLLRCNRVYASVGDRGGTMKSRGGGIMVPVPHQASEPGCDPRGAAFAGAL